MADRPDDRRCPPDIAGLVASLPKGDRPHILDVRGSLHFGDVPAPDQLPPAGADVQFLRVAKIFVNEVGNVLECTGIERRGVDDYPDCPTYSGPIGARRSEDGSAQTTWAVIALSFTKRPEAAPVATK
ncbi:hypothetical protein [Sphingomonas floccifaciens]|uniref:hypothetical protein n=1 Tax=Sphingomonas floccifaciens TaxID=1844115 RepID=UPI0036D33B2D